MKIKIDREIFLEKLSKAIKFIPTKTITPCFENIKLSVQAGVMEMLTSDGNVQCKVWCPVDAKEDFVMCIPAKLLLSTIALFRENEIAITMKGTKVELKNGRSKYNIGMDTFENDYPVMKLNSPTSEIMIHQASLKTAFKATDKFVNEKNPQPQMIGINMLEKDNKIVFTGLEEQLACRCTVKPVSIGQWAQITVPTDTAGKVASLMGDKGEVCVTHSGDKIMFYTDRESPERMEVLSVLSNQKFPNVDALMKNKTPEHMVVNTLEFMDALKRLSLYTFSGTAPVVVIKSNPDNNDELILTSGDDLTNKDGEEVLTVANITKKTIHKAFNADYIVKILSSVEEDEFLFFYNEDHKKPAFIEPNVPSEIPNMFMFLVGAIKI